MKKSLTYYFSKKIRFLFLSFTLLFLLIYVLIYNSFIFLIFFANLMYVFIAYMNKPTLIITDNELIQNAFQVKRIFISDLNKITVDESKIKFRTTEDVLIVKLKFLEDTDKSSLMKFVNNQSLINY